MKNRHGGVQSVDRALRILEALASDPEGLRLGAVAAATALTPSTTHRLLTAMQHRGFVYSQVTSGTWFVGRQAFRVGAAFARSKAFLAPATLVMRRLRDATAETVNLAEPEDGHVVILAQVESREVIRVINVIGGNVPLSSSALGKAILASYDEDGLAAYIQRRGLPPSTSHTLIDGKALAADLAQTRSRGYAVDREEHFVGLHCVAAPIFAASGDAVASLSASGLAERMPSATIDAIGRRLVASALELTRNLGGALPNNWKNPYE